jgi:hypothetical protein
MRYSHEHNSEDNGEPADIRWNTYVEVVVDRADGVGDGGGPADELEAILCISWGSIEHAGGHTRRLCLPRSQVVWESISPVDSLVEAHLGR